MRINKLKMSLSTLLLAFAIVCLYRGEVFAAASATIHVNEDIHDRWFTIDIVNSDTSDSSYGVLFPSGEERNFHFRTQGGALQFNIGDVPFTSPGTVTVIYALGNHPLYGTVAFTLNIIEESGTGSGSSNGATGMATGSTSGGAAATAKPMDPAEAAKLYEYLRSQGISFGTPSAPACNHSYEWVETKQTTENDNGECAYKCKLCGEVLYRVPTNAMGVFVQNTINNIVKAPQGGTVVIDTDRWYSFPKSVFDALAARPDLTLTVNYLSKGFTGDPMTFTIPAGTDVSKLPDEKGYAGFTFLGGIFNATAR
ncbi:hypothetical protein SAMN02910292_00384 [Lachnospiraceae bacterium XBB2008]|nr:hypothetical protein SAMN02910292_00384 [Lachnospiraceae bacterium XBB2008]